MDSNLLQANPDEIRAIAYEEKTVGAAISQLAASLSAARAGELQESQNPLFGREWQRELTTVHDAIPDSDVGDASSETISSLTSAYLALGAKIAELGVTDETAANTLEQTEQNNAMDIGGTTNSIGGGTTGGGAMDNGGTTGGGGKNDMSGN